METTILYLHGVGFNVRTGEWYEALKLSLAAHGIDLPAIDSDRILCPDYANLLKAESVDPTFEPAKVQRIGLFGAERLGIVTNFKHKQVAITRELEGVSPIEQGLTLGQGLDPAKVPMPSDLNDVRTYVTSPDLRYAILNMVLEAIGDRRELVIVAHSLGSAVAINLLDYLPEHVHVTGLITMGSPAGLPGFHKSTMDQLHGDFPYKQVDTWVNFLSPLDPVTRGIGLTGLFPAAHDIRVELPILHPHSVATYVRHPAVAAVLARVIVPDAVQIEEASGKEHSQVFAELTPAESQVIDGLVFAHGIHGLIKAPEVASRFESAVALTARTTAQALVAAREQQERDVPELLRELTRGEDVAKVLDNQVLSAQAIEEQLAFIIVAATSNLIAPYGIDVEIDTQRAVSLLWAKDFDFSKDDGNKILEAITAASTAFKTLGWVPPSLATAGLALISAGPTELTIHPRVSTEVLADIEPIVDALSGSGAAKFLGALVSLKGIVGTGDPLFEAHHVASRDLSVDMLRTQLVRAMAYTKALVDMGFVMNDPSLWQTINHWHRKLSRFTEKVSVLSDKDAPVIKLLQAKLKTLEQALVWLKANNFAEQEER